MQDVFISKNFKTSRPYFHLVQLRITCRLVNVRNKLVFSPLTVSKTARLEENLC